MSPPAPDPQPRAGWIAHEVAEEHPHLRVLTVETPCVVTKRSPYWVRDRLRDLSSRVHGAQAMHLREQEVPAAYRIFYRQIGLDPDVDRTPVEEAMVSRLMRGAYPTVGLPADALLVALAETGVPVWALDVRGVDGPLGVRVSVGGEPLGEGPLAGTLPAGRLVVADAERPLAELFRGPAPGLGVRPGTDRAVLFALQVGGVSRMHVEEALWTCTVLLEQD